MRTLPVIIIGAVIGVLDGVGIFWAPGEPYKTEIFLAAILKGVLVSLRWTGEFYGSKCNSHSSLRS